MLGHINRNATHPTKVGPFPSSTSNDVTHASVSYCNTVIGTAESSNEIKQYLGDNPQLSLLYKRVLTYHQNNEDHTTHQNTPAKGSNHMLDGRQ